MPSSDVHTERHKPSLGWLRSLNEAEICSEFLPITG